MRKCILIPLILLSTSASLHSGWFSKDKPAPDFEREQRLKVEERLQDAQQQIQAQQLTIQRLYAYTAYGSATAVLLLMVGVAVGSKVRRNEK